MKERAAWFERLCELRDGYLARPERERKAVTTLSRAMAEAGRELSKPVPATDDTPRVPGKPVPLLESGLPKRREGRRTMPAPGRPRRRRNFPGFGPAGT